MRHVQARGDSFAGDCRGKYRMRRELITVGRPVRELELADPRTAAKSKCVPARALLAHRSSRRSRRIRADAPSLSGPSRANRSKLIAISWLRAANSDGIAAPSGRQISTSRPRRRATRRGGEREFRTITYQPALWPGQTRVTRRRPQRWRWFEIRVHLHVAHWNPGLLPAPAMARFEAAV